MKRGRLRSCLIRHPYLRQREKISLPPTAPYKLVNKSRILKKRAVNVTEGKGPTSEYEQEEGLDRTNIIDWPESGGRFLYIHKRTKVGRNSGGRENSRVWR